MSTFFEKKVVWITGASSGLGEALAVELSKKKAKIILSARRVQELERVKIRCAEFISEDDILVLPLDVAALFNVKADTDKIINKFGRIDILINNAGVVQRSSVIDTSIDLERKMFEINYFGTVMLSKAVLPIMRKQNRGSIVVISSIMGKLGFPGRSTYSATKHALHGYFESLYVEVKKYNINVHLICPGYIRTNISINAYTAQGQTYGKMDDAQQKGMDPNIVAQKIFKAIRMNKFETFIGGKELLVISLKRLFPSLFYRLIPMTAKKNDF